MLRITPKSDEELQKVQELQALEHLQVLGVGLDSGDAPLPMSLVLHPPSKAGTGLDVGLWEASGEKQDRLVLGGASRGRI